MINLFKNIYRFSQKEVQKKSLLFRLFPDKYHPYISLGRYDKPIGFMLLYWPCAWGLALVSPLPCKNYLIKQFLTLAYFYLEVYL